MMHYEPGRLLFFAYACAIVELYFQMSDRHSLAPSGAVTAVSAIDSNCDTAIACLGGAGRCHRALVQLSGQARISDTAIADRDIIYYNKGRVRMDKKRLQWHPGFFAVLQIELEEERRFLRFYAEYNLTRKPLQIDVLVVRKETGRVIQKNIGRIFRQYNVVEYKGIKDYISINDFYKSIGYACLLQSNTERVQEILPSQVTVTLAGEHYPRSLHVFLVKAYGVHMEEEAPGIYYIKGLLFPLQILVIRELSKEDNIWLSRLRSELKPDEDIEVLMKEYKGKEQNPLYETAMDLILRANWETCQEVEKMCDALRELFADELEERETIGLEKGLEQGKMTKLITQVMRKREKGQSASRIAEDLMEPADVVQRLYDLIGLHPDSDAEHILAYMESWDKV